MESINTASHIVSNPTFLYLDGGSGSMLLQAALAGILSAAFVVRAQWSMFRSVIGARIQRRQNAR